MGPVYKTLFGYLLIALVVSFSGQTRETMADAGQQAAMRSDTVSDGPLPSGKGQGIGRDYQKATPGPGQGDVVEALLAAGATVDDRDKTGDVG